MRRVKPGTRDSPNEPKHPPASEIRPEESSPSLNPSLSPEETLLEEYHDLVDQEMEGELSEAQAARLREVQTQLDTLDAQDPHEQAINAGIKQTGDELDAMLNYLTEQASGNKGVDRDRIAAHRIE